MIVLSTEHFNIQGKQKKTLVVSLQGNVLVVFVSPNCQGCEQLYPILSKLESVDQRVKYASINTAKNKDVIRLSRESSTPIQYTPTLIFYSDGKPFALFKGTKNITSLQSFITKAIEGCGTTTPSKQKGMNSAYHNSMPKSGRKHAEEKYLPDFGRNYKGKEVVIPDDEEHQLQLPPNVIPYNMAWENGKEEDD